jgi:hypothetical protein
MEIDAARIFVAPADHKQRGPARNQHGQMPKRCNRQTLRRRNLQKRFAWGRLSKPPSKMASLLMKSSW